MSFILHTKHAQEHAYSADFLVCLFLTPTVQQLLHQNHTSSTATKQKTRYMTIPEDILQLSGAWGALALMGAASLAFSIFFTLYYSDKQDREPFAMVVTILALTLCLTTVALYPVDIFLVSNIMDPATGLRHEWATNEAIAEIQFSVKIIYYVAYGLIAGFCFFWVPLAYFYFEELADEEQTTFQRLWASFKYTIFFILVACILLLTGLLVKPHSHEGIDLDWLRKVLEEIGKDGTGAMAFVAGVLALAGMGILVFYTAPGLVLLPLHLLAGTKTMPEGSSETQAQLTANHERQNAILGRYQHRNFLGGRSLPSDRDRADLRRLEQEELILESRLKLMKGVTNSWFHRCSFIVRPLQILGGLLGVVLSALLVGSIAVTSIAQTNGDICGALCGHIFFNKELPNPINLFLLKLSPYFPADYMLVVMITLYMFWATIKGIISIGIRLLCVNLYKFRQAATEPQGLLAATMLLMLSLAGLSYTLTMSVAPEYSMFGSQKYCNYTMPVIGTRDCSKDLSFIIPCHVGAPSDLCVATVTSTTILKTILATPSFGIAFFYLQWLFLAVFAFALIFNVLLGLCRGFGVDPVDEDGDEDLEDGETRRLLSGDLEEADARRRARRREITMRAIDPILGHGQGLQRNAQGYGQTPMAPYGAIRNAPGNGRRG